MIYDYCVIGGGIVGLATAMELLESRPGASLVLLEKESELGVHQTGHNSGVIHAGIYYAPGSLKAELCRRGAHATKEFAAQHEHRGQTDRQAARRNRRRPRSRAWTRCSSGRRTTTWKWSASTPASCAAASRTSAASARCSSPRRRSSTTRAIARAMGDVMRERGATIELGTTVTGIAETHGRS